MTPLLIIAGAVFVLIGIASVFLKQGTITERVGREKTPYRYRRRNFFMSRAEHECYDALLKAVGTDYYVFSQVHLPTIVDHTIPGQDWRAAFAHINGKSVDFVLCDKAYISPKLAIELDDRSHERPDRQERDRIVERILKEASVPLLRIQNQGAFNSDEIAQKIAASIGSEGSNVSQIEPK